MTMVAMAAMVRCLRGCGAGLAALALLAGPARGEDVRAQEIADCRPGEIAIWNDGRDRRAASSPLYFVYRHTGAPAWFDEKLVATLVGRAVAGWAPCGVPTGLLVASEAAATRPAPVLVQWHETESRGNFGLADLGRRTLSLGPRAFALLRERNPAYDATQTLQMVVAHEMGHFFGLMAHSRRCVDVLSYYHDGKGAKCYKRDPEHTGGVVEYRHVLPTACDIERCRQVNGTGNAIWGLGSN